MKRSHTTHRPARRFGSTKLVKCTARAANMSSSSAVGGMDSPPALSNNTISRILSASGVPPGSRVTTCAIPRSLKPSDKRATCVDLPTPSIPSMVKNRPGIVLT